MRGQASRPGTEQVREPVAIVGTACRLPGGVDSAEAFWRLLQSGGDGVGGLDPDRWAHYAALGAEASAVLAGVTRRGGYLDDIAGFDAEFFGLTPREAEVMDPQHRLLLEVAWEALEDAGIPPSALQGGDAGVYVGIGSDDYGRRTLEDLPRIEPWTGIGAALCGAANRISYALDLRGPSLAVDTACSASLVALHLACQALRAGETSLALVGGVNVVVSPGLAVTLERAGALAADGRSKPFAATADGYGRGEGCGVLVLKRLADARRDGDRVHAVVLGSAVRQDGRTNGIMAPNGAAQAAVLAEACRRAGVDPRTVGYVEAHGTGTPVGDAVEAGALGSVYGAGRPPGAPCLIGSAKSSVGHLEAGAGVVGVLKAVLALRHGEIPATLHADPPNAAIRWDELRLRVVREPVRWPAGAGIRRAGVSGFGYGGTVAHIVLEEAPADVRDPRPELPVGNGEPSGNGRGGPRLFPVSAATPAGLRAQAASLADWLAGPGAAVPLADVGQTLARRRAHLSQRAAVVAADRSELVAGLRAVAAGEPARGVSTGTTRTGTIHAGTDKAGADQAVWVFSGHGSQWPGMGAELLATCPAFAAVIDRLAPVYATELGLPLRAALAGGELGGVDLVQPLIWAVQLGVAEVLRGLRLRPAAVIGHSVGEIAAAVVAGVLDLEAAARLVCRRSRLLRRVAGRGAMAMVALPYAEVCRRLDGAPELAAAVDAAPDSTVVSGHRDALDALVADWAGDGVLVRRVASDVAFHSPQMDPLLDELAAAADSRPAEPAVPVYSTALEDPRAPAPRDGAYWAANLRRPVRFRPAVQAALADGYRTFVELSPHPVVTHSIGDVAAAEGAAGALVLGTLRRAEPERAALLTAVGALAVAGAEPDWAALHPRGRLVALPRRAWQRVQHWQPPATAVAPAPTRHQPGSATLLGARTEVGGTGLQVWGTTLDAPTRPYPGNHTVHGVEIVPGAVLLATFLAAAGASALADVELQAPLTVDPARDVQLVRDSGALRLASREAGGDGPWLANAAARVPATAGPPAGWPAADPGNRRPADPGDVTAHQRAVGVPSMAFGWRVRELARGPDSVWARVSAGAEGAGYGWAPLLDAVLSVAPLAVPGDPVLRMISRLGAVRLAGDPPGEVTVLVRSTGAASRRAATDAVVLDGAGRSVAELTGLEYAELDGAAAAPAPPVALVHRTAWRPYQPAGGPPPRRVAVVGGDAATRQAVAGALRAAGIRWTPSVRPEMLGAFRVEATPPDTVLVLPPSPAAGPPAAGTGTDPAGLAAETAARAGWLLARTAQLVTGWPSPPALWCVTRGVREATDPAALGDAALWGLGRILAGEHPDLWAGLVDLDPADLAGSAALLPGLLAGGRGQDVIAVRNGRAEVPRLIALDRPADRPGPACTPDGTYLVTGGLGSLGLAVARWLVGRGARRLVLTGRRPFPPRSAWTGDAWTGNARAGNDDEGTRRRVAAVRELEAAGATVRVLELDAADPVAAARLPDPDALGLPPVRGVVHLAGVLDDRLAGELDEASLRRVLAPKAAGALVLHGLFPPGTLDFFVLFSSAGQFLGLPGQAAYAAGNAVLDALARHRAAAGDRGALSLAWTSWRGLGMSVNPLVELELRARGTAEISAAEAFAAWEHAARRDVPDVVVLRTVAADGAQVPPLLQELRPAAAPASAAAEAGGDDFWLELTGAELRERLLTEVAGQVAAEMRTAAADLDVHRPLADAGLDSVMFLIVRRRLAQRFRLDLPATLLWTRPTVAAIADHLAGALVPTS